MQEWRRYLSHTIINLHSGAIGDISKKVQESRLKWYGHELRREEEYMGKRVMVMEVPGKRRAGKVGKDPEEEDCSVTMYRRHGDPICSEQGDERVKNEGGG